MGALTVQRAVPAGMLDAGCASLATLAVGVYAARYLPVAELGAYSLFFSAFVLAAVIPAQLILVPAGIASVSRPRHDRLGLLPQTARLGGATAVTAAVTCAAAAWLAATAPTDVRLALSVTAAACAALSPLQDHVRSSLHLGGASWRAAAVSVIQLGAVVAALLAGSVSRIAVPWHPLGALAVANGTSLAFALFVSRHHFAASALPRYRIKHLIRFGRWLLLLEIAAAAAFFLSSILVSRLAGAEALGHAEAARIAAQPVFVMAVGLSAVLGPRSMEAGVARNVRQAKRVSRPFVSLLLVAAVAYGAVLVRPWPGNPVAALLPLAYAVPGLVLVSVLANMLIGVVFPMRAELLAARRERALVRVAVLSAALQTAVSAGSAWVGAFARPLGVSVNGAMLWLGYSRLRQALYTAGQDNAPRRPSSAMTTSGFADGSDEAGLGPNWSGT
jgi:O-antigen/teichoic acid export membrane protein